jgi:hypothetical protein
MGAPTHGRVSQPLAEPPRLPPATEEQVRSHAAELIELAAPTTGLDAATAIQVLAAIRCPLPHANLILAMHQF